jgi:DNA mismatch repair protein MutS
VREVGDQILFLHRLQPGGADRSYGIEVGRLAGLPSPVITRARELLRHLEQESVAPTAEDGATDPDVTRTGTTRRAVRPAAAELSAAADQLALFTAAPDPAAEALRARLRALDPDTLTPMQALALLAELTTAAREGGRG